MGGRTDGAHHSDQVRAVLRQVDQGFPGLGIIDVEFIRIAGVDDESSHFIETDRRAVAALAPEGGHQSLSGRHAANLSINLGLDLTTSALLLHSDKIILLIIIDFHA